MANKQKEYWRNIISYITGCQDVIGDFIACDGDEKAAKLAEKERLEFLMKNYVLRRNPGKMPLFSIDKPISALPIAKETKP